MLIAINKPILPKTMYAHQFSKPIKVTADQRRLTYKCAGFAFSFDLHFAARTSLSSGLALFRCAHGLVPVEWKVIARAARFIWPSVPHF